MDYTSALILLKAWCLRGSKPLAESMPTMIYDRHSHGITGPQWVKFVLVDAIKSIIIFLLFII